jgi:2-oxoglutarate dehydrogenase E1 component
VNGDDPEACVRVARLAFEYRQRFNKDVVIDMLCYRRLGHNEGDDPSYTQPLMYKRINARRSVRKLYTEALVKRGDISIDEAEKALEDFHARLQEALEQTRSTAPAAVVRAAAPPPPAGVLPRVDTGVDRAVLDRIYDVMSTPPEGFTIHPKLARQFDGRTKMFREEGEVDWALGEAFAFGSLLLEGTDIRVAGQDSRRGTFSHRHAVLVDSETEADWAPLNNLDADQAKFWIYDSLLSEYAALGFEWGYATTNPAALVAWEAQLGDFVNGAQIVIDQFIVAGLAKWRETSRLTLLLPHGYEGNGPEHSSARLERFLQLAAQENIRVANPSTSGQYFHLLRRQALDAAGRPLIVMTPKGLLRLKQASSTLADLAQGFFQPLIDDAAVERDAVTRLVVCSGKVYYDIAGHEERAHADTVAVARLEQLYPFPAQAYAELVSGYPNLREVVWAQEEPQNMGAWRTIRHRLEAPLKDAGIPLAYVGRPWRASPSEGYPTAHLREQDRIVRAALGSSA